MKTRGRSTRHTHKNRRRFVSYNNYQSSKNGFVRMGDEGYITRSPTPSNLKDDSTEYGGDVDIDEECSSASPLIFVYNTDESEDTDEPENEDSEAMYAPQLDMYKQVDKCIQESTLSILDVIYKTISSVELTPREQIEKWLQFIELGNKQKILFGMPCNVFSENTSLIDRLIWGSHALERQELSDDEKNRLDLLSSKISDLVSTGIYMSDEALKFLSEDLLEKRNNYLSNLKQIVCGSIEGDEKKDVVVERGNAFYYIQCPEKSIITPAKFINNPEFKGLEYGALQMGEGDNVIHIENGQYRDMKGKLQMTFAVGDEKIEITLSSEKAGKPENTSEFGKIMVHMDNKSCEIFSKYREELEKEPRISKVVEAAKSFVQTKPHSILESISKQQHSQSSGQGVKSSST